MVPEIGKYYCCAIGNQLVTGCNTWSDDKRAAFTGGVRSDGPFVIPLDDVLYLSVINDMKKNNEKIPNPPIPERIKGRDWDWFNFLKKIAHRSEKSEQ